MKIYDYIEEITKYTRDPYDIATDLGYFIHFHDTGNDILAFHYCDDQAKIICLNQNLSEEKSLFVLSHEIGHALMHSHISFSQFRKDTLCSAEKMEREANMFAAILLFSHLDELNFTELSNTYEIEKDVLKQILGQHLGFEPFWKLKKQATAT